MLTRRGFLIGAGSLLTAAFVSKATAFFPERQASRWFCRPPRGQRKRFTFTNRNKRAGATMRATRTGAHRATATASGAYRTDQDEPRANTASQLARAPQ